MMSSWWVVWFAFMFLLLVPPVGYGWGYRRWGPPYPRYIQRRRAAASGAGTFPTHQGWGWGGDFVWIVLIIGTVWFAVAFFMKR
jgi:hypothetical protein